MIEEGSTHLPFLFLVDSGLGCGAAGYGYIYADKQSPTLKLTDKVRHYRRCFGDGFLADGTLTIVVRSPSGWI
jgi:hypothetical protein